MPVNPWSVNIANTVLPSARGERQGNGVTVPATPPQGNQAGQAILDKDTLELSKNRTQDQAQAMSGSEARSDYSRVKPDDIRAMQQLIGDITYGRDLDALLEPDANFQVIGSDGQIEFKNYWHQKPDRKLKQGLCGELARGVGTSLSENPQFKDYEFKFATGTSNLYDSRPAALFPKEKPREGDHAFIVFWPKSNPEEKWIMDPCYGVVDRAINLPGYKIGQAKNGQPTIRDLKDAPSRPNPDAFALQLPENGRSDEMVLGLVKNLMPDAARQYGENARVYLHFLRKEDGRIESRLSVLEKPDSLKYTELPRFWAQPGQSAAGNDPLSRFMVKVDQDLAKYNQGLSKKMP